MFIFTEMFDQTQKIRLNRMNTIKLLLISRGKLTGMRVFSLNLDVMIL